MKKRGFKFATLHALANLLQVWADFLFKSAERLAQREQPDERSVRAETANSVPTQITQQGLLAESLENDDADGPPAHWLARVGTGRLPAYSVPRALKEPEAFSRKIEAASPLSLPIPKAQFGRSGNQGERKARASQDSAPSYEQPPVSLDDDRVQVERVGTGKVILPETVYALQGNDVGQREEEGTRQEETGAPVSRLTELKPGQWTKQRSTPASFSSPPAYDLPDIEASSGVDAREERLDTRSAQHGSHPFGTQARASGHSSPDAASEQSEMRWPALPEAMTDSSQEWEIHLRAWQRQLRLDKEQRGSSWNG